MKINIYSNRRSNDVRILGAQAFSTMKNWLASIQYSSLLCLDLDMLIWTAHKYLNKKVDDRWAKTKNECNWNSSAIPGIFPFRLQSPAIDLKISIETKDFTWFINDVNSKRRTRSTGTSLELWRRAHRTHTHLIARGCVRDRDGVQSDCNKTCRVWFPICLQDANWNSNRIQVINVCIA